MTVNTAQGAKIYIGAEDQDNSVDTQGEYESESWQLIGEVEDLGEFGDAWNTTEFTALADGRVRRFKTTRDAGQFDLVIGFDKDDTGQSNLVTALDSKYNYTFRVELDDAPSGSPSSPTTWYFRAMVLSNRRVIGTNDNIVRRRVGMAVNSDIIEVAAAS